MTKPRTKAKSPAGKAQSQAEQTQGQAEKTRSAGIRRPAVAAVEASATPEPAPRRRSTAAKPGDRPSVRQAAGAGVTDEAIRVRAYQLYLERKGSPADPAGDWLRAERELTAGLKPAAGRKQSSAGQRGAQGPEARE